MKRINFAPQLQGVAMKKTDFTQAERQIIDEAFAPFMQAVAVVLRLRGLTAQQLVQAQLTPDRSGFLLPEEGTKANG